MPMNYAPIALFVYARPEHTRRTVEALLTNVEAQHTHLVVYADAARNEKDADAVKKVREYVRGIKGFANLTVHEAVINKGLADSIVDGVTNTVNTYGRVIVVEDDLVTSPYFLQYMNDALETYADVPAVMHVAAHMLEIDPEGLPEVFFMRQSSCWGWGTWKRAWQYFSRDSEYFINTFTPAMRHAFNLDGTYDYWAQLMANHEGKLKTWAVYWYASVFAHKGLCLHPRQSLVQNIGFDGSGENCGENLHCAELRNQRLIYVTSKEIARLTENQKAAARYQSALCRERRNSSDICQRHPFFNYKSILDEYTERMVNALRTIIHQLNPKRVIKQRLQRLCMATIAEFRKQENSSCLNKQKYLTEQSPHYNWGAEQNDTVPGSDCPHIQASPTSRLFRTSRIANNINCAKAITIGNFSCLRGELMTFAHGGNIVIGDYCYVGEGTRIWSAKSIIIGHRVLISHNVNIFDSDTHPIDDYEGRHQQFKDIITTGHPCTLDLREETVVIEDDVLIACQSVILKGVTIGRGAVVGAGSVVTHDVAPFTLVAGNPARVVRAISPPKQNPAHNQEA